MSEQQGIPGLGQVRPENMNRINQMFDLSTRIMMMAKEGDIECCIIFFDRDNIPLTLRAGAQMSVGGILEAMNMMMTRAGVPEVHMEKIREELAAWAMERLAGLEAAEKAASDLVAMEKGVDAPLSIVKGDA